MDININKKYTGSIDDLDKMLEDIEKQEELFTQRIAQELSVITEKKIEEAYKDIGEYYHKEIAKIFKDAVTDFYEAYTPTSYKRRGDTNTETGGLYELLEIKSNSFGVPLMSLYSSSFDGVEDEVVNPMKMHPDRHGENSLYQTVFIEGWHGGAKGIAQSKVRKWGKHPDPGTPYYRKHVYKKGVFVRFGAWGDRAEPSTPPSDLFILKLSSSAGAIEKGMRELVYKRMNEVPEELTRRVPAISAEVYR